MTHLTKMVFAIDKDIYRAFKEVMLAKVSS